MIRWVALNLMITRGTAEIVGRGEEMWWVGHMGDLDAVRFGEVGVGMPWSIMHVTEHIYSTPTNGL